MKVNGSAFPATSGTTTTAAGITDATSSGRSMLTGGTTAGAALATAADAAAQRRALSVVPPHVLPDGLGANDKLVIVPDSATEGSTTFTDIATGRTLTATGAWHSTLRRAYTRSVMKFGSTAMGGTLGRVTAAQSDDFAFTTGDFTIQVLATVFATATVQRLVSQGRLEDGDKRWAFGPAQDARLNFAYGASGIQDLYSTGVMLPQCVGRPTLFEVSRASGTLRMFVDGTVVYSGSVASHIGVPVSGAPASADAIIFGARNPASPFEPLINGEIHFVRIVKGACLHTAAYDPTT